MNIQQILMMKNIIRLYFHSGPNVREGSEYDQASLYISTLWLPLYQSLCYPILDLYILNIKFIILPVSLLSGTFKQPLLMILVLSPGYLSFLSQVTPPSEYALKSNLISSALISSSSPPVLDDPEEDDEPLPLSQDSSSTRAVFDLKPKAGLNPIT